MHTQRNITTWSSFIAFCFTIAVLITNGQFSLFLFFFLFFTSGILLHLIPMLMEEKQIIKIKRDMDIKEIPELNISTFAPWMPNSSSSCPVPEHYTVQIKINGVEYSPKKASEYNWNNVTEYRVLTIDALSDNSQFVNDLQGYLKGQNSLINEKVQVIYNAIEKIQKNKLSEMSKQELMSLTKEELPKLISMYKKAENSELEAEFIEVLDKVGLKIEQYNREALSMSEKEFRVHAKYMSQKY